MEGCFDRNRLKKINLGIIACCVMVAVVFLPLPVILICGMQDGDTVMIVMAVFLMVILAVEAVMIIVLRKRAVRGRRYATIFEEDHDGVITFARINEMTGYGVERIKKDLRWLLRGSYIHNVIVEEDKIRLKTEDEIIEITCPTCGGVNRIRSDSSDNCEFCGSYLRRA